MTRLGLLPAFDIARMHTLTPHNLDATNDGVGAMFVAPKTGSISSVYMSWGAKTGTSPTYRIGIETGIATRVPNGTYLASGNAFVDANNAAITANSVQKYTLGSAASVTQGVVYWVTCRYQSGTIDASNFMVANWSFNTAILASNAPGGATLTAGAWNAIGPTPTIACEYDDGSIAAGFPVSLASNMGWSSSSSPFFRGVVWTPPATVAIDYLVVALRANATNIDFNVHLMQGTNATPMATVLVDADVNGLGGNPQVYWLQIPTQTLNSGTEYRVLIEPTTTNSISSMALLQSFDASSHTGIGAGNMKYTTATALGGPYTDTANQLVPCGPVVTRINVSGSGGVPLIGAGGLVY